MNNIFVYALLLIIGLFLGAIIAFVIMTISKKSQ